MLLGFYFFGDKVYYKVYLRKLWKKWEIGEIGGLI